MADQEQVALIRQGTGTWNQWRKTNQALTKPDLGGADLSGADLTRANLSHTNLSGANLREANLSEAALRRANLSEAGLHETLFINMNLVDVMGLEACAHHGPSTPDHRTLRRSGQLPLAFLRGCGLPDKLIDYLPSLLLPHAIQFY
jgi:hypothetical protein